MKELRLNQMANETAELTELIASFTTGKGEVEIVKLNHQDWTAPLYLTSNLSNGFVINIDGVDTPVMYAPMTVGGESSGKLLLNDRDLTVQGINDLVANYEDQIPLESEVKPTMEVSTYIASRDLTLSTISKGPLKYFANLISYNQTSNAATVACSTTRTNDGQTGTSQTITRFPTLSGFK